MPGEVLSECPHCHRVTATIGGRCPNCWQVKNPAALPPRRRYRPYRFNVEDEDLIQTAAFWVPALAGVAVLIAGVLSHIAWMVGVGVALIALPLGGGFIGSWWS